MPAMVASLTEQLKISTLNNHQQLEKILVTRLRSLRSAYDYIIVLQQFYSFFTVLENKISLHIGPAQLSDIGQRRKSGNLSVDLNLLNANIPSPATPDFLPQVTNEAQAFGAMYVMEGSTLGGQVICDMLKKQLGLNAGISFFSGYGHQNLAMWEQFKKILNEQQDPETVIRSADETFSKFHAWLMHSLSR